VNQKQILHKDTASQKKQNKPGSTILLNINSPTLFFLFFCYSLVEENLSVKIKIRLQQRF
jgi:hypothetical protein